VWECGKWAKLRGPYLTKIYNIVRLARTKVGEDTADYLQKLLRTSSFRHTGIVNADEETLAWAAQQCTRSTCPLYECQECLRWETNAQKIIIDGIEMMIVFTDGSANATNTDLLAYGGWGLFICTGSSQNLGGALTGRPTTSYRAEVRAAMEAIWRTRVPTCIVTDCMTVARVLEKMMAQIAAETTPSWPNDDGCHDYWETIAENLLQKRTSITVRWMPSHLDEEAKKDARVEFIAAGGIQEWIQGNCGADEMAKKGAALAAPPEHLMAREKMTRMLTKAVQRMAVHVWAAEKGIVAEKDADGHEADLDDGIFVTDTPEAWECGDNDIFASAFDDLMEATMPEQCENDWTGQHEEPDPWSEAADSPPQRDACGGGDQCNSAGSGETADEGWYRRLTRYKGNTQRIAAFYPLDQGGGRI
jgi:ribonuclease HI